MKRYLCIWDPITFENAPLTTTEYLDYFAIKNGYNYIDIYKINKMDIGEVYSVSGTSDNHIVVRIKDLEKE